MGIEMVWSEGCDLWWYYVVGLVLLVYILEFFDFEYLLFLLYMLGIIGKFKGIMYISGGYFIQCCYMMCIIFDVKLDSDVFWCIVDIGWVIGYIYGVYGLLCNGVIEVFYEGMLDIFD